MKTVAPGGFGRKGGAILSPLMRLLTAFLLLAVVANGSAQSRPRARELGLPFPGTPGPANAITDVRGVAVGHTTLVSGNGRLERGKAA
jgi:NAD-dependent oxidoreductase involved in siderophore biosynthesis